MEETLKYFMHTLTDLMSSGKLTDVELEAVEFALEFVTDEWVEELHKTQEHIEQVKKSGMMN